MHIISIVGPTAVGKSACALTIARHLLETTETVGVDVISADSRQVFKGLEILTGADIPDESNIELNEELRFPFIQLQGTQISLHGISIIEPTQEWSLAHFHHLAHQVIDRAEYLNRAVIVVGGTGLYQTQLLQSKIVGQAPPMINVREKAEKMSVTELQSWLNEVNPTQLAALNGSDRLNPRRIIRSLEKALWQPSADQVFEVATEHTQQFLGLKVEKTELARRIRIRVEQRLEKGALNEVLQLESKLEEELTPLSSLPAHSACGLREVLAFAHGDLDKAQCVELWTQREIAYARRQDTWWKKYPQVRWFESTETKLKEQLLAVVDEGFSR